MKLSEIRGERTLDVIADLVEPIAEMATDADVKELFTREKLKEGEDAKTVALAKVVKGVPSMLKNHKKALITVLSTLADKTYEEYVEAMTMATLVADIVELLNDEAFNQLFS